MEVGDAVVRCEVRYDGSSRSPGLPDGTWRVVASGCRIPEDLSTDFFEGTGEAPSGVEDLENPLQRRP